jgi:hypothetical protein
MSRRASGVAKFRRLLDGGVHILSRNDRKPQTLEVRFGVGRQEVDVLHTLVARLVEELDDQRRCQSTMPVVGVHRDRAEQSTLPVDF